MECDAQVFTGVFVGQDILAVGFRHHEGHFAGQGADYHKYSENGYVCHIGVDDCPVWHFCAAD